MASRALVQGGCDLLIAELESVMPRGDKSSYSDKQKRQAKHVEDTERKQGKGKKTAERIGWATVNKLTGGAKKGSKRKK